LPRISNRPWEIFVGLQSSHGLDRTPGARRPAKCRPRALDPKGFGELMPASPRRRGGAFPRALAARALRVATYRRWRESMRRTHTNADDR